MDDYGYLIVHSSFLKPALTSFIERQHITHKEPQMVNDLLNQKNFVRKLVCNSYNDRTIQRYYMVSRHFSFCLKYSNLSVNSSIRAWLASWQMWCKVKIPLVPNTKSFHWTQQTHFSVLSTILVTIRQLSVLVHWWVSFEFHDLSIIYNGTSNITLDWSTLLELPPNGANRLWMSLWMSTCHELVHWPVAWKGRQKSKLCISTRINARAECSKVFVWFTGQLCQQCLFQQTHRKV